MLCGRSFPRRTLPRVPEVDGHPDRQPDDQSLPRRQRQCDHLQQADGRMKSPVYWAGLVLMGDAGTVMLSPKNNYEKWLWLTGILAAFGALILFVRKRRNSKAVN